MKIKLYNTFILFFSVLFLNSCVVSKPDCNYASSPDYNRRVDISGAHYDKVITPLGYSSIAATTIATGYAGYQSKMIQSYSNGERKFYDAGGAIIGAAVGFTASYLINKALGWGKSYSTTNPQKWITDANKNYKLISSNNDAFKIINNSIEPVYTVKNIEDARQFKLAFPNSMYDDNTVKSGVTNCKRDELPDLIEFFPKSKYALDAKIRYIQESPSFEDLEFSTIKYSDVKLDLEKNYLNLITNAKHGIAYKNKYPSTIYKKKAVINSFITRDQPYESIKDLQIAYKNDFTLNSNDLKNENDDIRHNYLEGLYKLSQPATLWDLDEFFTKYNWLNYNQRPEDILEKYWIIGYQTFDEGNLILAAIKELSTNSRYDTWGIDNYKVTNFIYNKLTQEIKKNIIIKSTRTIGQNNSEWEKWCNNTDYTAGIVKQEGEIKYLVYGAVENRSKFELPINIRASADLYSETVGKGLIAEGANALSKMLTGKSINENFNIKDNLLASKSESFYIPVFPAKSSGSYAVLLNFGEGKGNSGTSLLWDSWKVVQQSYLNNVTVDVELSGNTISENTIENQIEWQKLAEQGLPDIKLFDLKRNEEVNDEVWRRRWQYKLEERRRLAEQAARERVATKAINESIWKNLSDEECTNLLISTKVDKSDLSDQLIGHKSFELGKKINITYDGHYYSVVSLNPFSGSYESLYELCKDVCENDRESLIEP